MPRWPVEWVRIRCKGPREDSPCRLSGDGGSEAVTGAKSFLFAKHDSRITLNTDE